MLSVAEGAVHAESRLPYATSCTPGGRQQQRYLFHPDDSVMLLNILVLKYTRMRNNGHLMSHDVISTEELIAYESKRKEAEENMRPLPEPVRARIPFAACLQAFTEPENVPDFWSSALQAKSAGVK